MSRKPKLHPLVRALQHRMPSAAITTDRETAWYSMTFAGERLELSISLSGANAGAQMREFADHLPDAEFTLPNRIVADIAVIRLVAGEKSATLLLEALVLEA